MIDNILAWGDIIIIIIIIIIITAIVSGNRILKSCFDQTWTTKSTHPEYNFNLPLDVRTLHEIPARNAEIVQLAKNDIEVWDAVGMMVDGHMEVVWPSPIAYWTDTLTWCIFTVITTQWRKRSSCIRECPKINIFYT